MIYDKNIKYFIKSKNIIIFIVLSAIAAL